MLAQERMIAFLGTTDAVRARTFYEGVWGSASPATMGRS